jgi:hypothetical protein
MVRTFFGGEPVPFPTYFMNNPVETTDRAQT